MSWRDKLRTGSWRGVTFYITSSDTTLGRRTARHDFPFQELPIIEDIGRQATEWSLEVMVIGPDYMAARDALMAALCAPGVGLLSHPYLGVINAIVSGAVKMRESSAEGGKATFTVTWVEATGASSDSVPASTARSQEKLSALTTIVESPDLRVVAAWVQQVIGSTLQQILGGTLPVSDLSATSSVIAQAGTVQLMGWSAAIRAQSISLVAWSQVSIWLQGVIIIEIGTRFISLTQTSAQELLNARAQLLTEIDGARAWIGADESTISGDMDDALASLAVAIIQDSREILLELPKLTTYTPVESLPALVISHMLYGMPEREEEIIQRNRVQHPLFTPVGPLEVLSE